MTALKYSRQREAIKDYLMSTTTHPTADSVYAHIRKDFPRISMGTVYRNLSLLAEQGELQQLPCADGGDRFDANTTAHAHFFCSKCQCVLDLDIPEVQGLTQIATTTFNGRIDSQQVVFHGLCPDCLRA